jgi:hypothetical protein
MEKTIVINNHEVMSGKVQLTCLMGEMEFTRHLLSMGSFLEVAFLTVAGV